VGVGCAIIVEVGVYAEYYLIISFQLFYLVVVVVCGVCFILRSLSGNGETTACMGWQGWLAGFVF